MFNTTSNNTNLKINATSGTITKTYKDSFITRFHMHSNFASNVLDMKPTIWGNPVVVLQCMTIGDGELIAEIIFKEDFDALFLEDGDNNG